MPNTLGQFDTIISTCRSLFLDKNQDYGTSWRILRPSSITDQLYIKAKRIRTIEITGVNKVGDSLADDYRGLINYAIMALIQMDHPVVNDDDLNVASDILTKQYDEKILNIRVLLEKKNHDYGEVWREMRVSSMTDLILMKLLRIKSIENNQGLTVVSEGISEGYKDIVNYSIFALIKLEEA